MRVLRCLFGFCDVVGCSAGFSGIGCVQYIVWACRSCMLSGFFMDVRPPKEFDLV